VEISDEEPYWIQEHSFESSLKPSLEMGFNFKAGPVRVKPALRAAYDIHEYSLMQGWKEAHSGTDYWVVNSQLINYSEPTAGITLAFDFANSDHASAEVILDADAAYRLYRDTNAADPIHSTWYWAALPSSFPTFDPADPVLPLGLKENYDVTIDRDLRIVGAPRFVYSGDVSQRLTLGVKVQVGVEYDMLEISQDATITVVTHKHSITRLKLTPDFSLGTSFHLIPDHFSLHAGLGLKIFSYEQTKINGDVGGTALDEVTKNAMELPSARFAAGLTLNLTETMAMDLMAITSGITTDATKFTLLLTIKN
jgi:hypothetical protein